MGNAPSRCEEGARASEVLSRESTEAAGANAANPSDDDNGVLVQHSDAEPDAEKPGEWGAAPTRTIELRTAPLDPRFPNVNAARQCYTAYNEFYRCLAQRGEGAPECQSYARTYRSICPAEWLERWNTLREEGRWFGKY